MNVKFDIDKVTDAEGEAKAAKTDVKVINYSCIHYKLLSNYP